MKSVEISEQYSAEVTQMRLDGTYGVTDGELLDGNMLPRLCMMAGKDACAKACQFSQSSIIPEELAVTKRCAEKNIRDALEAQYVNPENFALVSATQDRVIFGEEIEDSGATRHQDGYTFVPNANGFYFRPGVDMTVGRYRRLNKAAMRMADCGDVVVNGLDDRDKSFVGQAHFSRTNMRGPSAYMHELNGEKVSWGEYFIGSGVEHYGADIGRLQVTLVAAVEGKDFLHYYESNEQRDAHFPGWHELGFMHYTGRRDTEGRKECLIDYREMIVWQLTDGIKNPKYRLSREQIRFEDAINTGDNSLGHASHHKASHGEIAHGRDMYMVGLNRREAVASRIAELTQLQAGRRWTMDSFPEMSDADYDDFANLLYEGDAELSRLYAAQRRLDQEPTDGEASDVF